MNFTELQARTAERCGLVLGDAAIGAADTGPLAQNVRTALRRIETAYPPGWDWLRFTGAYALIPGDATTTFLALRFLLALGQDILKIHEIRLSPSTGAAFILERRSRIDADGMYPYAALGLPQCFWVEGRQIGFNPTPDVAYQVQMTVVRAETDLVAGTDEPVMPESYRDIIVEKAAELTFRRLHNVADASVAAAAVTERLKDLRAYQRPYTGPGRVRVASGDYS